MLLAAGTELGNYRLLELLGSGGFGQVWKAQHVELGQLVAVKVALAAEAVRLLKSGAVLQYHLAHPNVLSVHDVWARHDPPFIVMELVDGRSLQAALDEARAARRFLPVAEVVCLFDQILDAVAYAHEQKPPVVHGDLKPSNILVDRAGRVRIIDFDLGRRLTVEARAADATDATAAAERPGRVERVELSQGLTLAGGAGTWAYMAPEQRRGSPGDERSEIFTLGVLLSELLTGQMEIGRSLPSEINPAVPPALDEIVRVAQQGPRERRYASARALRAALGVVGARLAPGGGGWAVARTGTAPAPVAAGATAPAAAPEEWDRIVAGVAWADEGEAWVELRLLGGPGAAVSALAWSPDGKILAAADLRGALRFWDALAGREARLLAAGMPGPGPEAGPWPGPGRGPELAFSPDGHALACAGPGPTLRLLDPATGGEIRAWRAHPGHVHAVAFGPDGAWLATGGDEPTVRIWETATGAAVRVLPAAGGDVRAVSVAVDGGVVAAAGGEGAIFLHDPSGGAEPRRLVGHSNAVTALAFSPDGRALASGSLDRSVRLWDLTTGKERRRLTQHSHAVAALAFEPRGSWLVSGSPDHTLRVVDPATGRQLSGPTRQPDRVAALAVRPDGRALAVGTEDGMVRLWLRVAHGIDWSRSRAEGSAAAEARVHLGPTGKVVRAGELLAAVVEVRNAGPGPLVRLLARLRSESALFDVGEVPFGRVAGGAAAKAGVRVAVPFWHPPEEAVIAADFEEAEGHPPAPLTFGVEVRAAAERNLVWSVRIYDDGSGNSVGNGDGRIQPGEAIDLELTLVHAGEGEVRGLSVTVAVGAPAVHLLKDVAQRVDLAGRQPVRVRRTLVVPRVFAGTEIPVAWQIHDADRCTVYTIGRVLPIDQEIGGLEGRLPRLVLGRPVPGDRVDAACRFTCAVADAAGLRRAAVLVGDRVLAEEVLGDRREAALALDAVFPVGGAVVARIQVEGAGGAVACDLPLRVRGPAGGGVVAAAPPGPKGILGTVRDLFGRR